MMYSQLDLERQKKGSLLTLETSSFSSYLLNTCHYVIDFFQTQHPVSIALLGAFILLSLVTLLRAFRSKKSFEGPVVPKSPTSVPRKKSVTTPVIVSIQKTKTNTTKTQDEKENDQDEMTGSMNEANKANETEEGDEGWNVVRRRSSRIQKKK